VATYAVVAWRLLWLTYQARHHPEQSCTSCLETHQWQALFCSIHKTSIPPQQPPTLGQVVRWIAQLGGFLGRKGDGEPGVKTLWLGLRRLHDIAATWQLLRQPDPL
jgi:Transposase Tn5 dimerisation domain